MERVEGQAEGRGRHSLVIVVLDSLRYDFALEVPALAELATQGRWFTRMYAASTFTYANLATLRTGLYPPRHNWRTWPVGGPLRAAATLESCLHAAGYHISNTLNAPLRRHRVTELVRPEREPFFRFGWFTPIHDRLCARPIPGGTPRSLYRTYLDGADDYLVRARELFADCLLLVMADHGMGLRGDVQQDSSGSDVGAGMIGDFRVRVPCLLLGPGVEPATIDETHSMVDLLPMILELLELPIPGGLDGATGSRRGPVYLEAQSPYSQWPSNVPNVFGATDGRRKLWITPDGVRCYDLEGDPEERGDRPELVDEDWLDFIQRLRDQGCEDEHPIY